MPDPSNVASTAQRPAGVPNRRPGDSMTAMGGGYGSGTLCAVDDYCDECGFDGRAMTISEVVASLRRLPDEIGATVAPLTDERLRTRPAPTTWSAIEYLGHLRDLMAYHRWL